jgi:hypothetical protein
MGQQALVAAEPEVQHVMNLDGNISVHRRNSWSIEGEPAGSGVFVGPAFRPSVGGLPVPSRKRSRRNPSFSGSNTRGQTNHTANVDFFYRDSKSKNFTPKKKGRNSK